MKKSNFEWIVWIPIIGFFLLAYLTKWGKYPSYCYVGEFYYYYQPICLILIGLILDVV